MKRPLKIAVFVLVAAVLLAAGWMRIPYYAMGPGPARDVTPLIEVSGHPTYPSSGHLFMTTVSFWQVTPLQALRAWIDPNLALVQQDTLYPPGTSQVEDVRQGISQMDQSKIDATYVVLSRLTGYPRDHASGALVEQVYPGCPAEGQLYSGDLIISVDGRPASSGASLIKLLASHPADAPLTFQIQAAGKQQSITVTRKPCAGSKRPLVGIHPINPFPFTVSISSGDIGGPSAGLMYSLALYDLLTPGDLTRGRNIAGTGTMDLSGKVGAIGGIRDKVVAAERVGATIFLAPSDNRADLAGLDTGSMKVIYVSTFDEALQALRA
jgi:Lon-like protease